eukprot:TRINITY_DN12386_c0_g1_i3.p1 TRINITY_DN12386_c0_g1~~TRINITY_DN12386_c0_g1_i3.p1  ORF type:complete len:1108 (-),score=207.34 TRINITY_DN12386_c0_g1_i3:86-3298(-)
MLAAVLQVDCPLGFYRFCTNATISSCLCEVCPTGFYCPGGFDTAKLVSCPPAYTTSEVGESEQGKCICQPGHYFSSISQNCLACPAGRFKELRGHHVECTSCPNGTTSKAGSRFRYQCVCPHGTHDDENQSHGFRCVPIVWESSKNHLLKTAKAEALVQVTQFQLSMPSEMTETLGLQAVQNLVINFLKLDPVLDKLDITVASNSRNGRKLSSAEGELNVNFKLTTARSSTEELEELLQPSVLLARLRGSSQELLRTSRVLAPPTKFRQEKISCPADSNTSFASTAATALSQADCQCTLGHEPNAEGCSECPLGKFKGDIGDRACDVCHAIGDVNLTTLFPGQFSRLACTCPPGFYETVFDGVPICTRCRADHFCVGGDAIEACPENTTSPVRGNKHISDCYCSAGSVLQKEAGSPSCAMCPAGTEAPFGSSGCNDCQAGRFSLQPGSSQCEECPTGRFKDLEGSGGCKTCLEDFVPDSKLGPCVPCQNNTIANAGEASCWECSAFEFMAGRQCMSWLLFLGLLPPLMLIWVAFRWRKKWLRGKAFEEELMELIDAKDYQAFWECEFRLASSSQRQIFDRAASQVKRTSELLGVNLDYVLRQFKNDVDERKSKFSFRLFRAAQNKAPVALTQSGFQERLHWHENQSASWLEWWHEAEEADPPSNPNFWQLSAIIAYGDEALGKNQRCPRDGKLGSSIVDALEHKGDSGPANLFFSWVWEYDLELVLDSLQKFEKKTSRSAKDTHLWWCFFSNNQFRILGEISEKTTHELAAVFGQFLRSVGRMLMCFGDVETAKYASRIWCIFEVFVARENDIPCEVLLPHRSRLSYATNSMTLEDLVASCKVDTEKARATSPKDEYEIKELIRTESSFEKVNELVQGSLWSAMWSIAKQAVQQDGDQQAGNFLAAQQSQSPLTSQQQADCMPPQQSQSQFQPPQQGDCMPSQQSQQQPPTQQSGSYMSPQQSQPQFLPQQQGDHMQPEQSQPQLQPQQQGDCMPQQELTPQQEIPPQQHAGPRAACKFTRPREPLEGIDDDFTVELAIAASSGDLHTAAGESEETEAEHRTGSQNIQAL